jgi:hypothetical protein
MSAPQFVATVVYAWPLTRTAGAPHVFALADDPRPERERVARDVRRLEAFAAALGAMVQGSQTPSDLHITFNDVHAVAENGDGLTTPFTHHLHVAGAGWRAPSDWAVTLRVDQGARPSLFVVRLAIHVLRDRDRRAELVALEVNGVPQCVLPAPPDAEGEY